jgi:hypothetical protein
LFSELLRIQGLPFWERLLFNSGLFYGDKKVLRHPI